MNRTLLVVIALAAAAAAALALLPSEPPAREGEAFHVILAGPGTYPGGAYEGSFEAAAGQYRFDFVPNGSSPQTLSISLSGPSVGFARDFGLVGTLHESGISEYHTWHYEGEGATVDVPEAQEVAITIDPNGETGGSVSVFILEN